MLPETVEKLLGPPLYTKDDLKTMDEVGVATGLAWTAAGGDVLSIESTMMKGHGLTLTGQLGEVMRESAQTAMGYIRSKAQDFYIDESLFEKNEFHVHAPAGAIPKDGPSAGITLATALISLLTDTPIDHKVAMTGEITLTGKVLPVGGVKEKVLAAMRMGITTIIIPWQNKKDLIEIPEEHRAKIRFVPVKNYEEVLSVALVGWDERKKLLQKNYRIKTIPPVAA